MLKLEIETTIARLLAIGAPFVSIFLLIDQVSDPVNVTKMVALSILAFGVASIFFVKSFRQLWVETKLAVIFAALFVLFSTNAVINSDSPLVQNLYGTYGRNTGFLTYLCLSLVFLSTLVLRNSNSFRNLLYGLLTAGLINILYGGWTILFGDFVGWNNEYNRILGTFGNPNFMGAFLGIFASLLIAFILKPGTNQVTRVVASIALFITFYEIKLTLAVQGIVVSAGGIAIVVFFYLRSKFSKWTMPLLYLGSVAVIGFVALMGALQKGPLTSIVYKTSVSLRGEYWQAGINMGTSHPLTGVGMDAYGDWYRRARDAQAMILPGASTVSNTAHNVFIDIFAYGGYPLFISYIGIFTLSAIAVIRMTFNQKEFNFIKVGLIVTWACYQVQALISINQIGIAVWGWVTGGALIAYEYSTRFENTSQRINKDPSRNSAFVSSKMLAGLGMVIGVLISIPPLSGDIKWREAVKAQNADLVTAALTPKYMSPASSNLYTSATLIFEQNSLPAMAYKYGKENVKFNPENFDSWRVLYSLKNATTADKALAKENMIRLDPLNDEWKKLP